MSNLRRVLILEENTDHLGLLTTLLEERFSPIDIHTVETVEDCLDFLEQTDYDLVMTGCFIHNSCITDRLRSIVEQARGTPIIVISGSGDENIAAEVIKLGANEYIVKTRKSIEQISNLVTKYFKKDRSPAQKPIVQNIEDPARLLREIDHLIQKVRSLTMKGDEDSLEPLFSQIHRLRKLVQEKNR